MFNKWQPQKYLVMRNGHARARFCPPARYFGDARSARCHKNFKVANAHHARAINSMPGAPAGINGQ